MSQSNTLYIIIDPTGAQRGAASSVSAINSITNAASQLNISVTQIGSNTSNMARNTSSHFNSVSSSVDKLRGTINTVIGALAAIQVTNIFSSFVDEIKKVDREYNGFIAMMNVTTGDIKESAKAYDNIKSIALAYGVSIESLAKSYAKLSASTKDVLSSSETDRLFESFTATASVLHAEQYTVERMFNAIIQMASKGQVHMEELKQQLGEHLPGALALAAKAMKMDMGTMIEEMKKGNISARELLVPLPGVLMETFGEAAVISSRSLNAAFMNMKTTWFDSMKEVSTSGAGQGLAAILNALKDHVSSSSDSFKVFGAVIGEAFFKVAEFIKSISAEDVKKFAEGIVSATESLISFVAMAYEAGKAIVEYKDEIILVVGLLATYRAAMILTEAGLAAVSFATAAATGSISILGAVLGVVGAAVAGWQIGAYFREKFIEVELAGIALASGLTMLPVKISGAFQSMAVSVPRFFAEMFQGAVNQINKFMAAAKNLGSDVLKSLGFEGFEKAQPMKLDFLGEYNKELADIATSTSREVERIKKIYDELADDAINKKFASKGSLTDKLGISKKEIDDAEARVAKFLASAQSEFDKNDKGGKKGGKGPKDHYSDDGSRGASAVMDEYKVFSEQLKTLREDDQISTNQYYAAQLTALLNYTESAKNLLRHLASVTTNPEDKERLNSQLLKLEYDYQINATKLTREQAAEREKLAESLYKNDIESGVIRLSKQEEFINKWKENQGKMMQDAQMDGDTETIDRLLNAFNTKIGELDREDKITMDKFFATDDEKWFMDAQEQYLKMHEFVMASTAFTEEQKNALIEQLADKHNAAMAEKQTSQLLNFTGAAGSMVGAFAGFAKNMAGETSKSYKVLFAISKAFAIADATVNAQGAIMKAYNGAPWPANMALVAQAAAAVGGVISQISSIAFAGAYDEGGNIPTGKWGIVGEYGPEIVNGPANVTSRKDTAALLGAAGNSAPPQLNIKNINVLDPAIVGDYLSTDDGERIVMNIMQRNKRSLME